MGDSKKKKNNNKKPSPLQAKSNMAASLEKLAS